MRRFKVRELAIDRGIGSAPELARRANLGQATVYNLWDNKRDDAHYSTLEAIAAVLNVRVDELVENISGDDKIRVPAMRAA